MGDALEQRPLYLNPSAPDARRDRRGAGVTGVASVLFGFFFLGIVTACDGVTDPSEFVEDRDTLVVGFSGDTVAVRMYGGQSGRLINEKILDTFQDRGREALRALSGVAIDQDRRILVGQIGGGGQPSQLLALSLPELDEVWRERISDIEARSTVDARIGGIIHQGERHLLMRASREKGDGEFESGTMVLDRESRTPVGALTWFTNRPVGAVTVPGVGADPDLLVTAGPRDEEAVRLFVHDAETLAVRDSLFLATPTPGLVSRFKRLASARDGRHVYALTLDSLFRVDVRKPEITVRVPRARPGIEGGSMPVLRNPPRLFITDPGSFCCHGTGELQVYDGETLSDLGTVDLNSVEVSIPAMAGTAFGKDEDRLYVASGTAVLGGFTARGAISVVDPRAMTRVKNHDIGGWSIGSLDSF